MMNYSFLYYYTNTLFFPFQRVVVALSKETHEERDASLYELHCKYQIPFDNIHIYV